ncbi:MAG: PAAR domain-containing protein [Gemmobacter sp.]|uniref:PAAR domain-containing protein n=1 Tax=Gemmobacter sp. TaxID=1898957 RepID=UPI001A415F45|nr:PAAR domain-containing protein [Gemmobacter sp.]MBL8563802.1 PAAR domain-containing protein [Gemmobacter sp.]
MPVATRLGDTGSGHGCHFPPTPAIEASGNVFVNGLGAVRQGDHYGAHGCPSCPAPAHPRSLSGGSGTVFINGKPAGRVGDAIGCGGAAAAGSGDVFIGG